MSTGVHSVAAVTGATSDIGVAIVKALAKSGRSVIVGYRSNPTAAQAVVEALNPVSGPGHIAAEVSVQDSASVTAFAQQCASHAASAGGVIDVVVNCAGVTEHVPHDDLDSLTDDLIDWIFAVNVRGAFAIIRALAPEMSAGSTIVNISSVAATTGVGSNVAYCASKAAVDSMTRSLGRALAPDIRVVSVSPGWVAGRRADTMPDATVAHQMAQTPLGRLAGSAEVGAAVVAAVDHLTCTTGAVIPVDGGRLLGAT